MINRLKDKAEKYWILYYYDADRRTFNPGVQVSDWTTVREIEKITSMLMKDGREVHISTTPTVYSVDDLRPQKECIENGPSNQSYDPFLMW